MNVRTDWSLRPLDGPVTPEDKRVAAQIKVRVMARRAK